MIIVFASLALQNSRQITQSDRLGFLMKCLSLELPKLHLTPNISEMPLSLIRLPTCSRAFLLSFWYQLLGFHSFVYQFSSASNSCNKHLNKLMKVP